MQCVEQCVAMKPDRIALFGYPHVRWVAKNQRMIPQPPFSARVAAASGARSGTAPV